MNPPNPKEDIALRFQKLRDFFYKNAHGSVKECAEKVGLSQSAWSDFEAGRRNLTAENALKVHEAFGVRLKWIIAGKGEMFSESAAKDENETPPAVASGEHGVDIELIEVAFRLQESLSVLGQHLAAGKSADAFPEVDGLLGNVQKLQERLAALRHTPEIHDRTA